MTSRSATNVQPGQPVWHCDSVLDSGHLTTIKQQRFKPQCVRLLAAPFLSGNFSQDSKPNNISTLYTIAYYCQEIQACASFDLLLRNRLHGHTFRLSIGRIEGNVLCVVLARHATQLGLATFPTGSLGLAKAVQESARLFPTIQPKLKHVKTVGQQEPAYSTGGLPRTTMSTTTIDPSRFILVERCKETVRHICDLHGKYCSQADQCETSMFAQLSIWQSCHGLPKHSGCLEP